MRVLFSVCSTDLGLDLRPSRAFATADSEISQQSGRWEQWFPRVRKHTYFTSAVAVTVVAGHQGHGHRCPLGAVLEGNPEG